MTSFTPGPWKAGSLIENGDERLIYTETGAVVTAVYPMGDDVEPNEREANARLIAAAPEMHSELENVATRCGDPDKWDRDYTEISARTVQRIRALLATIAGE